MRILVLESLKVGNATCAGKGFIAANIFVKGFLSQTTVKSFWNYPENNLQQQIQYWGPAAL